MSTPESINFLFGLHCMFDDFCAPKMYTLKSPFSRLLCIEGEGNYDLCVSTPWNSC